MKSSRERTILITVLSVAGLGLLVDRVVIGSDVTGPAQTSAGVIDGFDSGLVQPPVVPSAQVVTSSSDEEPVMSFAQRLRMVAGSSADTDPAKTRDAFSPGTGWEVVASGVGSVTDNQARELAEAFQGSHVLDAVFVAGDQRYAVIGGQTLRLGQELDGYRLAAVHERSVIFEARGIQVEIGLLAGSR